MEIRVIKNDVDFGNAVSRLLEIQNAPENSIESQEADVLLVLIDHYQTKNHPIIINDPIATIKLKMEERGIKNKDLGQFMHIGNSYVSQILNGRKPMTIEFAKGVHNYLNIPAEILLG